MALKATQFPCYYVGNFTTQNVMRQFVFTAFIVCFT